MSDTTRPTGAPSATGGPTGPDARGETALGTGHAAQPHTNGARARGTAEAGRDGAPGTHLSRDTAHDGTDANRADVHGTGPDGTAGKGIPGAAAASGALGASTSGTHGTPGASTASGTPGTHGTHGTPGTHGAPSAPGTPDTRLLPHDESDKLVTQLHHAVAGFVDGPRSSVEEADHVLEEITARFTEAVTQRRRTLRRSWQELDGGHGKTASSADTEQLRLALKDYRELAERLLHV